MKVRTEAAGPDNLKKFRMVRPPEDLGPNKKQQHYHTKQPEVNLMRVYFIAHPFFTPTLKFFATWSP